MALDELLVPISGGEGTLHVRARKGEVLISFPEMPTIGLSPADVRDLIALLLLAADVADGEVVTQQ